MDYKHNHILTTPLAFALTVCWSLFVTLPHSLSQPPPVSLSVCGEQSYICNPSVSVILDSPSQCIGAEPSFQLSCYTRDQSQNFTAKDIDNTTHTMKVVPTHTVNDVCSPDYFDIYEYLNNTLFRYYASVHSITIFFDGCPHIPDFLVKRNFTCGDDLYYFVEEYKEKEMLDNYPKLKDCKRRLNVDTGAPLDHYDDSDDGAGVLKEALSDGFRVSYGVPPDCRACSESNGTCESYVYDEQLVSCKYYCPNQHCSPPKTDWTQMLLSCHKF